MPKSAAPEKAKNQPSAVPLLDPAALPTAVPRKQASPTLGSVVRSIRTRNDWTLKEMSQRTGIPLSTLAKVEHDRLTLTYDKLQQLSQRLQIPMSSLFAEATDPAQTRVSARRSIGRLGQFMRIDTGNYEYRYLCTDLRQKRMIPVMGFARTKSLADFGPLVKHAGEEFIYVLEGRLEVHTEFYEPVLLEAGECIYLDSTMGHAYLAGPGCEQASLLAVCSSAEDGLIEALIGAHGNGSVVPLASASGPPASGGASKIRPRKRRS